ncbi:Arm DNA-binding domain-containing protein [Mucilaginibacter sabulilitoris]|uniref:Arm DNA-binding domain-containing protein n=1 Tax=Mucilaginibacter sabulilitoris TaxID=1173583 RepID=A0ABZ0TT25_9SPHI|nr:Arm DNA-binding domain-containing protein [Mucilaginibacter sabulilitoris]WPU94315.1 Arm DNA-binding domain-containing protein [Mucilaginibacter sabulilitoris]
MATIAIVLNTTKKLSNGEYAVALRVTHDRQSKYYSLSMLMTNQSLKWRCTNERGSLRFVKDN